MGRVAWSHLPAASGFSSKFKQHFLHVHMSFFSFLNVYGRFSFLLGLSSFVSQTWLTHTVMWHDGEWFLIYCPHHHHHHHDFHCHSAAIVVVTLLPPPSYQLPTLVATVSGACISIWNLLDSSKYVQKFTNECAFKWAGRVCIVFYLQLLHGN